MDSSLFDIATATAMREVIGTYSGDLNALTYAGFPAKERLVRLGAGFTNGPVGAAVGDRIEVIPLAAYKNFAMGSANPTDDASWLPSQTVNGITITRVGPGIDADGLDYADYRFQGTATGATNGIIYNVANSRTPAMAGQEWTASAVARVVAGSISGVTGLRLQIREETAPGAFVGGTGSNDATAETDTVISATRILNNAATNQVSVQINLQLTLGVPVDVTFRIKGLQLEQGAARSRYQANPIYEVFEVAEDGQRFLLAAPGATDHDVATAGGVKLYRMPMLFPATLPGGPAAGRGMHLIAHRGFANLAPQNTMAAFSLAARHADAVECDVAISSDGVAYLFHDTTVQALTNGTGTFTNLSSATIDGLQIDAAGMDAEMRAMVKIPRFSVFLDWARRRGVEIWPEMKSLRNAGDVALICQQVVAAQMASQAVLQSFSMANALAALAYHPSISCGFLTQSATLSALRSELSQIARFGHRAWLLADKTVLLANPLIVSEAAAYGVRVGAWTVDTQDEAVALMAIGVRHIMSNVTLTGRPFRR